jgi:hypothetical protein
MNFFGENEVEKERWRKSARESFRLQHEAVETEAQLWENATRALSEKRDEAVDRAEKAEAANEYHYKRAKDAEGSLEKTKKERDELQTKLQGIEKSRVDECMGYIMECLDEPSAWDAWKAVDGYSRQMTEARKHIIELSDRIHKITKERDEALARVEELESRPTQTLLPIEALARVEELEEYLRSESECLTNALTALRKERERTKEIEQTIVEVEKERDEAITKAEKAEKKYDRLVSRVENVEKTEKRTRYRIAIVAGFDVNIPAPSTRKIVDRVIEIRERAEKAEKERDEVLRLIAEAGIEGYSNLVSAVKALIDDANSQSKRLDEALNHVQEV